MVLSFIHQTGQLHINWICIVSFQHNLNEFVVIAVDAVLFQSMSALCDM